MPKSIKFISIDSISILDNVGAGTAVNGSFELKFLPSDYFARNHKSTITNTGGVTKEYIKKITKKLLIYPVAYCHASKRLRMLHLNTDLTFSSNEEKILV